MRIRTEFSQDELGYVYESAKLRMASHPDLAKKYNEVVDNFPHFKTLEETVNSIKLKTNEYSYQIWAKVGKDEEYYYIEDYYITSNDYTILIAAEYIGMENLK